MSQGISVELLDLKGLPILSVEVDDGCWEFTEIGFHNNRAITFPRLIRDAHGVCIRRDGVELHSGPLTNVVHVACADILPLFPLFQPGSLEVKEIKESHRYTCSICNAPATVDADGVHRTCDHNDAAVIANMTAHATGQACVNGE